MKKELENKDKLINVQSTIFANIEEGEKPKKHITHFSSRNLKNEQSKTLDNIKEVQNEDELVKQIDSIISDFRRLSEQIIDKTMRNNINKQIASFEFLLKSLYSIYHNKIQESSSKINSLSIIVDQNKFESNSLKRRVNELMKELQSNLYPSDVSIITKLESLSLSNFETYNSKLDEILKLMKVKQKKEENSIEESSIPVQVVELRDKEEKEEKRNTTIKPSEYSGSFIFPQKTIHI